MKRREFLATSALLALFSGPSIARANSIPWRNWSGGLVCEPTSRFSPTSTEDLVNFMRSSTGTVRPVGSGHSFSPLVPTNGHLVILDQLTSMIEYSSDDLTAKFGSGIRLSDIGPALNTIEQAMPNLPDIDRQTLAGATATATHGTGIAFPALSDFVTHMQLVSAAGDIMEFKEGEDALDAARVSLGALGIATEITLQNQRPFRLKARNSVDRIESVLERFDNEAAKHRHFEMFPLTHSDYALVLEINETNDPINNPPPNPEEAAAFGQAMAMWAATPPKDRLPLVNGLAEQIGPTEAVDVSYKILSNIRNNRFNEMEYSVPLHAGADCLSEILKTIIDKEVDVVFPLEYRYVKRDDSWIGMSSGDEDHAAISIHRTAGEDYRPYFDLIEPIFWKYGGRPHWGKIHSLGAEELSRLYPRFGEFQALRKKLDPQGRLLNDHLQHVFGVR